MARLIGTVSRGVRAPIIKVGDDIATIVADSVIEAAKSENLEIRDRDVIAMTESIVARAQGNYASIEDIAEDQQFFGAFALVSVEQLAAIERGTVDIGSKHQFHGKSSFLKKHGFYCAKQR